MRFRLLILICASLSVLTCGPMPCNWKQDVATFSFPSTSPYDQEYIAENSSTTNVAKKLYYRARDIEIFYNGKRIPRYIDNNYEYYRVNSFRDSINFPAEIIIKFRKEIAYVKDSLHSGIGWRTVKDSLINSVDLIDTIYAKKQSAYDFFLREDKLYGESYDYRYKDVLEYECLNNLCYMRRSEEAQCEM